jgi:AraC-like DNA-binding protein
MDIQVKDLLQLTNMSNTAFYNAFKYSYRMPFKTYLMSVRVGYACRLLIEGTMSVSEIAYDSGFENLSNFNRQFKKMKGVTPSQFRQKNIHT